MQDILSQYYDIIQSYEVLQNEITETARKFKIKIYFINSTKLEGREFVFPEKRNYSFQWMNEDNSLIIRWDNAEHHRNLDNFPYHKHTANSEQAESSIEITLVEVLAYIRNEMSKES
ncbi:MAG TPA: DUF6516 family protein [Leptospiraceae bacterium]|nr:DUF6516 family protein [Leptospiraceae bacterium]HRG77087.1 DUF6516 family protein [Leptospiraceae bacterium]